MIEFVFGRQPSQKTEYVVKKMKESLEKGKKIILIIPEQQALFWDTLCASRFSPESAFSIETVSFSRLCNSVFRRFGGIAKNYADNAHKTLFMWNAINSVRPFLTAFKSPEREDRYVSLIKNARNELLLYGITPEDIIKAADSMDEGAGSLPDRLRDLALISSAYDTLLKKEFFDPEEMLDALDKTLSEHDFFSGTSVFIDSFYTLTPKEKKIVRHIFKTADDTLITFGIADEDRKKPCAGFVADYMKDLARIANGLGLDVKKTSVDESRRAEFSYLAKNLWDFSASPYTEETDAVTVIKCCDRYDEAALAGKRIKQLVAEGAAFGDIACVSADFESLRGIFDIELERQGIPVYVSGKTPVTAQPAFRLLLYVCRTIAGGWKREDIVSVARTGLCDLTPDEADAIEMYTDKWRIRGKKGFCPDGGWSMNADGYSESESPWAKELLTLANSARDKLIPPIEAFSESFPGTVRDICTAAYKLLCDFSVYGKLREQVSTLEKKGHLADAQKKSQVFDAVCRVLDILVSTIPDEKVEPRLFSSLLTKVADTCLIGTIPDGIDRVNVGSVGSVRTDGISHLIVLGAKSGEFPRVPKEQGFFSDSDKYILKKAGIEISPDTLSKQREEMFRFGETVTAPSETLTLFIPSDQGTCHPSLGAIRITSLFPKARVLDFTCPEAERIIRTEGNVLLQYEKGELSADCDRVSDKALERLFDRDITLTQSRIECYNSCPFQYFCKYVLKLDESEAAQLQYGEVGTFVHSVLENFMKEAVSFPIPDDTVISRTERLVREYREKIVPEGQSGHIDYMFDRITKSIKLFAKSLNEEFSQSRFVPHSFELKVGFSDDLPALPTILDNGHSLTVRGIVDRMDVLKEDGKIYIRVVDYKTGSKKFSLTDVRKGHNIQLLLYLFALCNMPKDCTFARDLAPNGEEILPAGAVYFSAKPGDIASRELIDKEDARDHALSEISRTGLVVGGSEIVEAMDCEMAGKYAPAYLDKKGNLKGSFMEDGKELRALQNTINDFISETGNRLTGGDAASTPSGYKNTSACENCAMRPVCRHNNNTEERSRLENE